MTTARVGRRSVSREMTCRCRMRTLARDSSSFRETLNALIQTPLPPWVPRHTSANPPKAIGLSPVLARSPHMIWEDGKVVWWPQMARNLRKHCRKMSSEVGIVPRAYKVQFATVRRAGGKGRTSSRKSTSRTNSSPSTLDEYRSSSSCRIKPWSTRKKSGEEASRE